MNVPQQKANDDDLTRFRTAWLRAIAMAWASPRGSAVLADNPKLVELPPEWNRLELQIHRAKSFIWVGDMWTWEQAPPHAASSDPDNKEDELTIFLPLSTKIPEDDLPIALAAYYQARASIFAKGDRPRPEEKSMWSTRLAQTTVGSLLDGNRVVFDRGPKGEALFPNRTSFSSFTVALMSALAKSWTSGSFRRRLIQDPSSTLSSVRDYTVPWKLNIIIKDDPGPTWDSTNGQWDFTNEQKNVISLCLPERPENGRDQVLALAAYNATGAEYPFTCCP